MINGQLEQSATTEIKKRLEVVFNKEISDLDNR